MDGDLQKRVVSATKWSALAEFMAKLITPLISLVLARLLTPEAYGIVATITMVITFVEVFTDAGFQKYVIQHEVQDEEDLYESTNVAFWSNFLLSLLVWGLIIAFRDSIVSFVGSPGYGYGLAVACAGIPVSAFSSLQIALFRRNLDFQPLFKVRIIGVLIPLIVTIPLAVVMRSYWALIIGTLSRNVIETLVLSFYSKWWPRFRYSFDKLKEMFSFTVWTLMESVSIWFSANADVFIVASALSAYYLGLYKTASGLVGQLMNVITTVAIPILFASLSRLQNQKSEFDAFLLSFQQHLSVPVFFVGGIIFSFSDILTSIMLGEQWSEAAPYIGLLGFFSSFAIVLSYVCSEAYRAKGLPKISLIAQIIHVTVMVIAVKISVGYGFIVLYKVRALLYMSLITVNMTVAYITLKLPVGQMLKNLLVPLFSMCTMIFFAFGVRFFCPSLPARLLAMPICFFIYIIVLSLFKNERPILLHFKQVLVKKMPFVRDMRWKRYLFYNS